MNGPVAAPLFRAQALAQARGSAYGTVLLARPLSHRVLTALFVLLALVVVGFLGSASYTRKARLAGVLLPDKGLIRVSPAQAGVVTERRVAEGQAVQAGDVLFVLVSERAAAASGSAEAAIAALLERRRDSLVVDRDAQRLQARQRADAAQRKAEALDAERARITRQMLLQQRRVEIAQSALQRTSELAAQAFVSAVQVQDKQAELLDQQQKLADLERAQAAVGRDIAALRDDTAELQLQARRDSEAGVRSIADTDRDLTENEARRRVLVRAPQDGRVSAITADIGQAVQVHQALATLLPAGSQLEAELYAPSRAAGFLSPGTPVMLRYEAYAFQKFGQARGTVREVASSALRPEEVALPGAAAGGANEPLVRVRVTLPQQAVSAHGTAHALRAGTAVDASVLLETRRLYEWLLEPLLTVKGRL